MPMKSSMLRPLVTTAKYAPVVWTNMCVQLMLEQVKYFESTEDMQGLWIVWNTMKIPLWYYQDPLTTQLEFGTVKVGSLNPSRYLPILHDIFWESSIQIKEKIIYKS